MTTGTRRIERYEVIIIGAGQAGLAAGYWLGKQDIDFLILDAHPRVGDVWRRRWDSLRLFTPARYSGLPGMPFPGDPYHLPTRNEVADYLEWYARTFELPVRNNVLVRHVHRVDGVYEITTNGTTFQADNVIVATGAFHTPRVPAFSRDIDPAIVQLHSSEYQRPDELPDGDVMVVGAGNSGAQIAIELSKTRRVFLAGRSVGSMRRRVLGRDVFDWLWRTVMRPGADSFLGRRIRQNVMGSSDALIGMTESDLARAGILRTGRVVGAAEGQPVLADGTNATNVRSIVWCTGFSPDFGWIDVPVFGEDGFPRHARGVTAATGLYFLGLRFLYRLNSSLIGGVGADARHVAAHIAARYAHTTQLAAHSNYSRGEAVVH
jgi:putative flavoprotein involved in K+ transport